MRALHRVEGETTKEREGGREGGKEEGREAGRAEGRGERGEKERERVCV